MKLDSTPGKAAIPTLFDDFPGWFTLRGHAGEFRIDKNKSSCDGIVVIANLNGREVGRCSPEELRENVYAAV